MINCLLKELKQKAILFSSEKVNTIYFGGGTPSLLSEKNIDQLINTVYSEFRCSENLEVTLEANPEDFEISKFKAFKKSGINRLSIGVQSFHDSELVQLNRAHNANESKKALEIARIAEFENISIDLMFGLPLSDLSTWETTLQTTFNFDVEHISCYNLTVEEKTALWHLVNKKSIALPTEINQEKQYTFTHDYLTKFGYNHYEISNYSQPGFESNHNSNYWNKVAYLGIGPSAHSYLNNERFWNISNNAKYVKGISENSIITQSETLTEIDQFNELIMLGLRKKEGIAKIDLEKNSLFSEIGVKENFKNEVIKGNLQEDSNSFFLSPEIFYISDSISSRLFFTPD